jgi:tetratricopeptide (TPR) repeat protein
MSAAPRRSICFDARSCFCIFRCAIPTTVMRHARLILILVFAATSSQSLCWSCACELSHSGSLAGQSQESKPAAQSTQPQSTGVPTSKPASNPGAALDFLGSYSAPEAVLATETGHTSARPPSATTDRRLAELASDLGKMPAEPAELRRWLIGMLAGANHSPEDWFRIGMAALQAARADSRRLAEFAPSSSWNRRLEAEALASRYPALARTVWRGTLGSAATASAGQRPAQAKAASAEPPGRESGREADYGAGSPADAGRDLARFERLPESPENLYARAHLLIGVSEQSYTNAIVSPQLDARLYALEALAAEDENDEGGALSEYQSGLSKYPESALLHAGLGHLYRERNDLEAARGELIEAWQLDRTDALVGFELGDVELRMGQPGEALALLNQALELDPKLLVARWARGRAYLAAGGAESDQLALQDLQAAESCDRSGTLEHQLSQLYSKLGRTAEAQEAARRSEEQRRTAEQSKRPAAPPRN